MPPGFAFFPEFLNREAQVQLLASILALEAEAPFFQPTMPRTGQPLSVQMTNLGSLGWVSDRDQGYRYQSTHPVTGRAWPAIPTSLIDLWDQVSNWPDPPQACLVNLYRGGAKMGLHVDKDERALNAPVVSVSLGDKALFRIGGPNRSDPTASLKLSSGDVVVLGGAARQCFHGIDRVIAGSSTLVPGGGRINLTMRVVQS